MAIQQTIKHSAVTGLSLRVASFKARFPKLFCFILGAVMALTFAPFYVWPLLFICLPVFFLVLDAAPSRRSATWRGFFFGYGYFMAGTWWIANALTVDMAKFGWLIPFSVLGLSAVMALWFAVFGWLYGRLRSVHLQVNLVWFAVLWVLVEYLRSLGMFGFPWNLLGYTALASLPVAQLAALFGTYGLSLLILCAALTPLLWRPRLPAYRMAAVLTPIALIALSYAYGTSRLKAMAETTGTTIRVVQPNIPQAIKVGDGWLAASVTTLNTLSNQTPPADITIWPETAYPLPIRSNRVALLKPAYGVLLTGALRVEGEGPTLRLYNSAVAIDTSGLLLAAYDKHQLVPFGEFVPLRSILPLDKITPGALDFTRGSGPQTLLLRDQPSFSPLVCYEAIFPALSVRKSPRPEWLLNVTNDGWYGDSSGPHQHLAMARMRSIEQGLPLVRAANTGISVLVDPYGRILQQLFLNTRGTITASLPRALPPTPYATMGEWPIIAILALALGVLLGRNFVRLHK